MATEPTRKEKIRRARTYGRAHGYDTFPGGYVRHVNPWWKYPPICQGWIQLWDTRREVIERWERECENDEALIEWATRRTGENASVR